MGKPEKPITKEVLSELYEKDQKSVAYVAAVFGCNPSTIRNHLRRKGIRIRSQSEEMSGRKLTSEHRDKVVKTLALGKIGKDNPNWKNGRSWRGRTKDSGYIIIRIDGKYVPEHRYVMEQSIGRKLEPNEHVHHINGIRTDNHLENLLVLTRVQHAQLHMTEDHRGHLSKKTKDARSKRFWSTKKRNNESNDSPK